MKVPSVPPVGHVIAYEYLWHSQAGDRDDGRKTYPCAIVMAVERNDLPRPLAYVVAMSHSPPRADQRAIEVPAKLKRYLGLDDLASWVYVDELNIFAWPGPDLRPAHRLSDRPMAKDSCVIGPLPSDWFDLLKAEVAESHRLQKLTSQKRGT